MTALPKEPRYVTNLKLHHRQMHYRQSSSFKEFQVKKTTQGITNILAVHHKLMLFSLKPISGGVNLVGLSLEEANMKR